MDNTKNPDFYERIINTVLRHRKKWFGEKSSATGDDVRDLSVEWAASGKSEEYIPEAADRIKTWVIHAN